MTPRDRAILHVGCEVGPECDGICNLDPLPGESRADWIARLRAMVAADPRYDSEPGRHTLTTVACDGCGRERARGFPCVSCDPIPPILAGRPA